MFSESRYRHVYELRYAYQYWYFRLVETIFDLALNLTTESIYTSLTLLQNPHQCRDGRWNHVAIMYGSWDYAE
jgi:hypothetical protein